MIPCSIGCGRLVLVAARVPSSACDDLAYFRIADHPGVGESGDARAFMRTYSVLEVAEDNTATLTDPID